MGDIIQGDNDDDYFGASISLSADGSVLAVGAPQAVIDYRSLNWANKEISPGGRVRVYKYVDDNQGWLQRGDDITGTSQYDCNGYSVSLQADGKSWSLVNLVFLWVTLTLFIFSKAKTACMVNSLRVVLAIQVSSKIPMQEERCVTNHSH